jgi:hypothetical protein
MTARRPAALARRRLAALLALPLLAGCAGEPSRPEARGGLQATASGLPSGATVDAIRGGTGFGAPLRPEPGNIWADGLAPGAATPAPGARPGAPRK